MSTRPHRTIRLPLRVVFYYEHDRWVAHCLEFDLLGDGKSQKEALDCLSEALVLQVTASLEHDNPENLFTPAEGVYFRRFAEGRHVAVGEFNIQLEGFDLHEIEAREYKPDEQPVVV